MELARLRHPAIAANAPREFREMRVEFVDIALGPVRDLPVRRDAELVQHPLEHRSDTDDQLEVVRRAGAEQRRRRVVLDVENQLAIARGLGACLREIVENVLALGGEFVRRGDRGVAVCARAAKRVRSAS